MSPSMGNTPATIAAPISLAHLMCSKTHLASCVPVLVPENTRPAQEDSLSKIFRVICSMAGSPPRRPQDQWVQPEVMTVPPRW